MPAIVLLSGGLDSAVNLKRAHDDVEVAVALTFDYGQRAATREAAAAAMMCRELGVSHRLIELPWLAGICESALVNEESALPTVRPEHLDESRVTSGETAEAVWVPNRNGVFVNVAGAFADSLKAEAIVAGFNAEEAATFPDNSAEFASAATTALAFSTRQQPRVMSYTQDLAKADIVRLGREIGAPIECIWSCYCGKRQECWECESCARLERALREANSWEWFCTHRVCP
ncbi:MAG: 7-cyano-7-deazaguanine synthase QueC [Armatimonadetes bacterium]|nr:7-cyano-7-deazaguanine synthase QueC [Armatimonadota bacterium]